MVLHVFKSNIYSGAENVVCQIMKGLENEQEFVYMAPHGPIVSRLLSLGLFSNYHAIDKLTIANIRRAVEELQPDIIQAHDFTASVLCAVALRGSVPVISHIHCNPLWLQKKFHPNSISYLFASRWFDQILTVSEAVMDEYCYSNKISCPVKVVGNPFSIKRVLEQAAEQKPTDEDMSSDVLYVGRFNEAKNPMGALQIVRAYGDKSIRFRMVGEGELLEEAKDYATGHNMKSIVEFDGFQENVYKYMAKTKVLLMPSVFEGFGLVALEALALGVPVVCSGVGGLSDIVTEECGYICKNAAEYKRALIELLNSKEIRLEKSAAARERAKEFDNIDEYLNSMRNIYKSARWARTEFGEQN